MKHLIILLLFTAASPYWLHAGDDPKSRPGAQQSASDAAGTDYAAGAYQELQGALSLPKEDRVKPDNANYSLQYGSRQLSQDQRIILALMESSYNEIGGDGYWQLFTATHPDAPTIRKLLRSADRQSLSRFSSFTGTTVENFPQDLWELFDLRITIPPAKRAGLANTYLDHDFHLPRANAFLIFGLGMGYGRAYWINQALHSPPGTATTVENYFIREYQRLEPRERAYLGVLLLANPAYDRHQDTGLRALFHSDAFAIQADAAKLKPDVTKEYCRWNQISPSQFQDNLRDILAAKN
jgi:hypothetical protein